MRVELELTERMLDLLGDEWEVVAVRPPSMGEHYISERDRIIASGADRRDPPRIIVRRKWTWPEWIKPGTWIAMDMSGKWFLYTDKPKLGITAWFSEPGDFLVLGTSFFDWTPPPVSDWNHSLMQKPMEDK